MNDKSTPLNSPPVKKFIPGIAWFFLVLIVICLPGSKIPTIDTWLNDIYFDKWVHAGMFGVLTFLFIYPVTKLSLSNLIKKNTSLKIAIAAIIWGLTTEFIQRFFIPGRSFDIFDWAADSFGILSAYIFCYKKYLT